METVNLRNELTTLQKTIADGAVQFDVKGIKTKIAARQLIGTCVYMCMYVISVLNSVHVSTTPYVYLPSFAVAFNLVPLFSLTWHLSTLTHCCKT